MFFASCRFANLRTHPMKADRVGLEPTNTGSYVAFSAVIVYDFYILLGTFCVFGYKPIA